MTGQAGQSSVEFALVVPLLLVVTLFVGQVGVVVHAKLAVVHGAREAARALAVDPSIDPLAVVEQAASLPRAELNITVDRQPLLDGREVLSVTLHYAAPAVIVGYPTIEVSAQSAIIR